MEPDESDEMKKHMKKMSDEIKRIVDPWYKKLCWLSEKINNTNTAGLEISTPTGTFIWKPKWRGEDYDRTIN